mmetsp:Transcript_30051/g.70035  ORF Transcript_30051/g.70035 Transcript_30051/m.70035 type:complete len:365 (-) Transcript_30051:101-1195(-)
MKLHRWHGSPRLLAQASPCCASGATGHRLRVLVFVCLALCGFHRLAQPFVSSPGNQQPEQESRTQPWSRRFALVGPHAAACASLACHSGASSVQAEELPQASAGARWLADIPPWDIRRNVFLGLRDVSAPEMTWRPLEDDIGAAADGLVFPKWLAGEWDVKYSDPDAQFPIGMSYLESSVPGVAMASVLRLANIGNEPSVRWRLEQVSVGGKEGACFDWASTLPATLQAFWEKANVSAPAQRADPEGWRISYMAPTSRSGNSTLREATLTWLAGRVVEQSVQTQAGLQQEVLSAEWLQQKEPTLGPRFAENKYRVLMRLRRLGENVAEGRLRVAGYLKTSDLKYFDAADRAVVVYDYQLRLQRV